MTVTFMALVSSIVAERYHARLGYYLVFPLSCIGIFSVVQWYWSELNGTGDLRFYVFVQVIPFCLIPFMMYFFPGRYSHSILMLLMVGIYGIAKVTETMDKSIYEFTGNMISGHTIKHLLVGLIMFLAVYSIKVRKIHLIKLVKVRNK